MIPGRSFWSAVLLSGVCLTLYSSLHSRMETEQRAANSLDRDWAVLSHRRTLRKVYAGDYAKLKRPVESPEKQRISWLEAINAVCTKVGINNPRVMFSGRGVLEPEKGKNGSVDLFSSIVVTETPVKLLVSPRHELHLAELLQELTGAPDMLIELRGCDVSATPEGIDADCRLSLYTINPGYSSNAEPRAG